MVLDKHKAVPDSRPDRDAKGVPLTIARYDEETGLPVYAHEVESGAAPAHSPKQATAKIAEGLVMAGYPAERAQKMAEEAVKNVRAA